MVVSQISAHVPPAVGTQRSSAARNVGAKGVQCNRAVMARKTHFTGTRGTGFPGRRTVERGTLVHLEGGGGNLMVPQGGGGAILGVVRRMADYADLPSLPRPVISPKVVN